MLDRRRWSAERSPCLFLLTLPDGEDRCGVYADRPVACGAYPMILRAERISMRDDPLCPSDAWPADEPARPAWRAALQRARMDFDVYHAVVERWNAGVRAGRAAAHPSDYYDYLLRAYAALEGLEARIGPAGLADLRAAWRAPLDRGGQPMAWQRHLEAVRALLATA